MAGRILLNILPAINISLKFFEKSIDKYIRLWYYNRALNNSAEQISRSGAAR